MKYLCIALMSLFVLKASAQPKNEKSKILSVLQSQELAWNSGNLNEFMKGYEKTDSLLFVGGSGPTYGWQKTLDNYKKGYPDKAAMGILKFDIRKISILAKDVAFVMGSWALKREKDMPNGYFTLLFKKINGDWKIAVDHTSSSKN